MVQSESHPVIRVALLREGAKLPFRATPGSTGFDIYACLGRGRNRVSAVGTEPVLIPTGIAIEFLPSLDVQIRPRSGLSSRGNMVSLGTIDSDYRGEIFVTMYTVGNREPQVIRHGDRIAQMVVGVRADVSVEIADSLGHTNRGEGGHGSTGD